MNVPTDVIQVIDIDPIFNPHTGKFQLDVDSHVLADLRRGLKLLYQNRTNGRQAYVKNPSKTRTFVEFRITPEVYSDKAAENRRPLACRIYGGSLTNPNPPPQEPYIRYPQGNTYLTLNPITR